MIRALLLLSLLALQACGGAAPSRATFDASAPTKVEQPEAVALRRALLEADEALGAGLQVGRQPSAASLQPEAKPNGEQACALRDSVCALSKRICVIAARHAVDLTLRDLCRDGQRRCKRAQGRLAEHGQCEGVKQ